MTLCDIRTHGECACEPGECRVQNLGTFTKTAPVFTFTPRDMLIVAALMSGFFAGSFWMAENAFERVNLANQETTMVKPRENRVPIMMSEDELTAIDDWRFANRVATRSEAVRRLCQIALALDCNLEKLADDADDIMRDHVKIELDRT